MDPRTVGWLQRALAHELGAVQQYLAQSVLVRLWGDAATADALKREAQEELGHAERLMRRLIELGRAPSGAAMAPARLGRDLDELNAANRELEREAVHLYDQALAHAERVRDVVTAALLDEVLRAELVHLESLQRGSAGAAHGRV